MMTKWFQAKAQMVLAAAAMLLATGTASRGQTCMATSGSANQHHAVAVSAASLRVPEKAWKYYRKAVDAVRLQGTDEFTLEIGKALEVYPNFAEAYVLRASRAISQGHFDAAIEDVSVARRIDPSARWTGVLLAGAYNGLLRYHEALAITSSLSPTEAATWQGKYEMARAVIGLNDVPAALHWSLLALEAAPADCIDARLLRANAFLLAHRWNDVVEQLTLYAASSQPQFHRDQVLRVLDRARVLAQTDEHSKVASIEPTP